MNLRQRLIPTAMTRRHLRPVKPASMTQSRRTMLTLRLMHPLQAADSGHRAVHQGAYAE